MLRKTMLVIILAALLTASHPAPDSWPTPAGCARNHAPVVQPVQPAEREHVRAVDTLKAEPVIPGWGDVIDRYPNCRESHVDRWCR